MFLFSEDTQITEFEFHFKAETVEFFPFLNPTYFTKQQGCSVETFKDQQQPRSWVVANDAFTWRRKMKANAA